MFNNSDDSVYRNVSTKERERGNVLKRLPQENKFFISVSTKFRFREIKY